jgi:hypothetical protein
LSGPVPVRLVTIFYCLRLDTSLLVASYESQCCGGGIRFRLHTGDSIKLSPLLSSGTDHAAQKTQLLYCCIGVLAHSCLRKSLGAGHIENTFYSCRIS